MTSDFRWVDVVRPSLQDSNSEKDRLELFWGQLFDDQVTRKEEREERVRGGFLALVFQRESQERESELLTCVRGYVYFYSTTQLV